MLQTYNSGIITSSQQGYISTPVQLQEKWYRILLCIYLSIYMYLSM